MTRSRRVRAGIFALAVLVVMWASVLQPGFAQADRDSGASDELELITAPQSESTGESSDRSPRDATAPDGTYLQQLAAAKRRAATLDPAIAGQQVDDMEEFSGPGTLSHTVNVTFPGLNFATSQHNGNGSLAPDPTLAANGSRVLEATNFGLSLFTTAGGILAATSLNTLFSAPDATYGLVGNPKVYYDRTGSTPRFFIVAVSQKDSTKISRIWIAVSRAGAPSSFAAAAWCRYQLGGRMNAGTSLDSYASMPAIGFGADAMVISVDNLTWAAANFTFAFITTLRKLVLENNGAACPAGSSAAMKVFKASTVAANDAARSLQPVQHYDKPSSFMGVTNPVYLIATDPFGSTDVIRVWRVANVAGTATFVGPYALPNGLSYDIPPNSPQLGSSDLLNTFDSRIHQAAGLANTIHAVFATVCNMGGGATESCIRYVRVGVSGPSLAGAYQQQITFGSANVFFWSPGVAVNLAGKVLVVYERGSSTQYLKVGYTGKTAAATIFEASNPMPLGTCTLNTGNPGWNARSVGVATDSGGVSFWLAGERASPTPPYAGCWWETDVRKVTPP